MYFRVLFRVKDSAVIFSGPRRTFSVDVRISVSRQLAELYSLMKSVALVIESSQGKSCASALAGMRRMIGLIRELEQDQPLRLHDPSHFFRLPDAATPLARGGAADTTKGGTAGTPRVTKEHDELTPVAQITRGKLREAITSRFVETRFGEGFEQSSHLFDMVSALNPCMRQLVYISHLAPSDEVAQAVKRKVWSQLESLAKDVIEHMRSVGVLPVPDNPPAKKLKFSAATTTYDDGADFFMDDKPAKRPSQELAREAIEQFRTAKVIACVCFS